jgi:hypothetical protein
MLSLFFIISKEMILLFELPLMFSKGGC